MYDIHYYVRNRIRVIINFMFYVTWNFIFAFLILNEIYNLNLTVTIITKTERNFINHRSGSTSINNPITSDEFM
jgi:hypothetical protein